MVRGRRAFRRAQDVLEKLNSAINAALADPVVAGAYEPGMIKTGGTLDKAQAKLQQEVKNWALAVQVSGAKGALIRAGHGPPAIRGAGCNMGRVPRIMVSILNLNIHY